MSDRERANRAITRYLVPVMVAAVAAAIGADRGAVPGFVAGAALIVLAVTGTVVCLRDWRAAKD